MNKKILLPLLSLLILFGSCRVNSQLIIKEDLSGAMENRIELAPFFSEFFFDIFERDPLLAEIHTSLMLQPGFDSVDLGPTADGFDNSFTFADFHELSLSQGLLTLEENQGVKNLSLNINRENWSLLEEMIPMLADPSISYMGPSGSEGLSREEFREMLVYPFDGYAPSWEASMDELNNSYIHLEIEVEGEILQVENCTKLSSSRVRIEIPLFDLLMLDSPLSYALSYR